MASNLLEVTWKGHLRLLHESPTAYSSFMGDVATYTGVATMGMMVRRSSKHRPKQCLPSARAHTLSTLSPNPNQQETCMCHGQVVAPFLFSRFGWAKAASFTPKLLIFGGIPFFMGCTAHRLGFHVVSQSLMLYWLVLLGAGCMIFSRAAKFSLFKV
jgi:AAA family ATP:ADP antiporter